MPKFRYAAPYEIDDNRNATIERAKKEVAVMVSEGKGQGYVILDFLHIGDDDFVVKTGWGIKEGIDELRHYITTHPSSRDSTKLMVELRNAQYTV